MDKELVKEAVREVLFEAGLTKEYHEQRLSMSSAIKIIGSRKYVEEAVKKGRLKYVTRTSGKTSTKLILVTDILEFRKELEKKCLIKIKTNG